MNIQYDAIADRAFLKDAAQKRAAEIELVLGGAATDVSWDLRTEAAPRELVLVAQTADRRAEESISFSELRGGDGPFTDKLKRMKDALADNGEWRVGVRDLMQKVRVWCRTVPDIEVEDYQVVLNEERSGRYALPALRIRRNGTTARLEPIAGWVIEPYGLDRNRDTTGERAIGRVNLDGAFATVPLYLLHPSRKWVYQDRPIVPTTELQLFGTVDRNTFSKLLGESLDD